jgi:hypothetical protein
MADTGWKPVPLTGRRIDQLNLTRALTHAHAQSRVLFTHDRDHLMLSASGTEHFGIAYGHQRRRGFGEIVSGLVLIWELLEPDEMRNRVEFI